MGFVGISKNQTARIATPSNIFRQKTRPPWIFQCMIARIDQVYPQKKANLPA
jgi:hypothetical protein